MTKHSESDHKHKINNNGSEKPLDSKSKETDRQRDQKDIPSARSEEQLVKLEEALSQEKDKYLRLVAEFDNFKKRNVKDRIELLKYASEELITALLPVLDDFERAQKSDQLPDGVNLIYQKFVNTLQQKGLKAMEAAGTEFNPDLHDAISQLKADDELQKNKVIEEIEKGYYLGEKVIRHAKVVVGK